RAGAPQSLPRGRRARDPRRALGADLLPARDRALEPEAARDRGQQHGASAVPARLLRRDDGAVIRYLLGRLALFVPTLLLLSAVTFFVGFLTPSDPVIVKLGQHADPAAAARLRH